jgi:hypothetical protein
MGGAASREPPDEERQSLLGDLSDRPKAALGVLRNKLGLAQKPPPPPGCCPELSYTTRLVGFAFCFGLGWLLSLTSFSSFAALLLGNPLPFAFKYTLGNLLSLCSYCFLVGPRRQCTGMFAPERRLITFAYLGSLLGALLCIFYLRSKLLIMVAVGVQFVAMYAAQICLEQARNGLISFVPSPAALAAYTMAVVGPARRIYYALSYLPFGTSVLRRIMGC